MTSAAEPLIQHCLDRLGLQPFLDESGVEDVAVQEPGVAWVRRGAWERYDVPAADLLTLEEFAIVSGSLRRQEFGSHAPILDTELPGGPRLNVVGFPQVPPGTISITIRKHEDKVAPPETILKRYVTDSWNKYAERAGFDLEELRDVYKSGDLVAFLIACVRTRQNIVLAGATGSSKTTLLKTLCSAIDHSRRIITIEDALELTIIQPNHVRLVFKRHDAGLLGSRPFGTSPYVVDAQTLCQAAMRMHPDVVILGEMRGKEAWNFVRDVIPPHPGSIISIHANSPASAFSRMVALCKADPAAASYDDHALAAIVANAVDVIIPLEQIDKRFHLHPIWFRGASKNKTALDLLDGEL